MTAAEEIVTLRRQLRDARMRSSTLQIEGASAGAKVLELKAENARIDAVARKHHAARALTEAVMRSIYERGPGDLETLCRELLMHRRREAGGPVVAQTEEAKRLASEWFRWRPPLGSESKKRRVR